MTDRPHGEDQALPQHIDAAKSSPAVDRLSAGSQALDVILGGGIPRNSLYILTGPPGAGKTIMAQQLSFAAAKAGLYVIYFTNVSEPHSKLVEHMRAFDFYDPDLLGRRINIYNITSQIRDKGFQQTLDFIVDTVRSERASLVIIDSFRGLKHVLESSPKDRGAIFDLAARMSIMGCTSVLVGEYTPLEAQTDPEFAVADGIIYLTHATEGIQDRRALRVVKMRGVRYLGGEHSFVISTAGIVAYPRQEALAHAPEYKATNERSALGIADLDELLYGGLIRSSSTLIAGSSGTGKTVLSLHFLAAGAQHQEHGLMISFQENAEQLRLRAGHFGLAEAMDSGYVHILPFSPVELNLDAAAAAIRDYVARLNIRRVVIDSVAELESASNYIERFDDFLASLIGFLRQHEVTTVMTREIPQMFGTNLTIASRGLSYIVDNIILIRYFELSGAIDRTITILKSRGSNHAKGLYHFGIEDGRIVIGPTLEHLQGLITGIPTVNGETPADPAKED